MKTIEKRTFRASWFLEASSFHSFCHCHQRGKLSSLQRLDPLHLRQTNLAGTESESGMPEHLVCCHTPQTSQANILSPSSSFAPQQQSTVHPSVPLSILNLPWPVFPRHLPRSWTDSADPIKRAWPGWNHQHHYSREALQHGIFWASDTHLETPWMLLAWDQKL